MAGAAQTRGPANHRFVELLPERGRPHERLVVEAGDEDRREERIDRSHIETDARPRILAPRHEPVEELRDGRAGIGLPARAAAQLDQGVRLLGSRGDDAARPVVLEGAADEAHAGREQCGGERISGEPRISAPVEIEPEGVRTVDDSVMRETIRLRWNAVASGTHDRLTARISWVRVLRFTLIQLRHP